ncbi:MAG: selenide, water dikinase SelD [Oligoflexia bacterium]|nr:selenide, water dikinase SelD [Oligoflexia bacterium]
MQEQTRLTQFSPGAGCGCKISPQDLQQILSSEHKSFLTSKLLVGHDTCDDAAVYLLDDENALVSTTDFFTPIVDDPYDFGRIAATNAISDVYAMGGKPILALAVLGWPLEKLKASIAKTVIDGAREVCRNAEIPLAGGHSIDISDPIFGLMVNGIVKKQHLKQNSTATPNCKLFLTKPLGIGLISTAQKRNLASAQDVQLIVELMTTLNRPGELFAKLPQVVAMTDVTGFGFLGHLLEMCSGSNVAATIDFAHVPRIPGIEKYLSQKTVPGGTYRNFKSYGDKILFDTQDESTLETMKHLLCDPQTSGGLLLAVTDEASSIAHFLDTAASLGLALQEFGHTMSKDPNSKHYIHVA